MTKGQNTKTGAPANQSTGNKKPVPPTHVIIKQPIPTIHTEPKSDVQQDRTPEKPLPRFLRPEWVIVYITAIYVPFTILIWLSVRSQVKLMDQQRQDTNRSSTEALSAIKDQRDLLKRQAEIMQTQANLTQAQFNQWVILDNWRVEHLDARMRVRVDLINPTQYPITLSDVISHMNPELIDPQQPKGQPN